MAIERAMDAARSGLRTAATRVAVVADNIANGLTPGYRSREVVSATVRSGTGEGGGVRAIMRTPVALSSAILEITNGVRDGSAVEAGGTDGNRDVQASPASDVNMADQYSTLIQARAAYESNLVTLRIAEGMAQSSRDIVA